MGERNRAVPSLDSSATGTGRPNARRGAGVRAELHQRVGGRRVVGEPGVAEHRLGARGLERRPLQLGAPRREHGVASPAPGIRGFRRSRPLRPALGAECGQGRLDDRLPAGAAAQVSSERGLDVVSTGGGATPDARADLERSETHQDPGCTEAALAGPGAHEGTGPAVALLRGHPLQGGDPAPGHAPHRGDARDAGSPVHPDGATAALALGTASVLDRTAAELVSQRVEKRDSVSDADGVSVQDERDVTSGCLGGLRAGVEFRQRARIFRARG